MIDPKTLARWAPLVILLAEILFFWSQRPNFFTWENWHIIINNSALLGIVAVGLTIALMVGDFDLSIAGAIGLGGVIAGQILSTAPSNLNIAVAVLGALAVGALIGVFNGAIVTGFGINAFVATLGTGALLSGIILWRTDGGKTITLRNRFQGLANSEFPNWSWLHPKMMVWFLLAVVLLLSFVMAKTVAGRRIDAVGGNVTAARLSGIRVSRYRVLAFAISGMCAAGTGVLLASRSGSANANAGDPFLLEAYTAAFLGAVTLRNREFHVWGTLIGVLFLKVTFSGIALMGWPTFWNPIVTGGILILAVSASGLVTRLFKG